MHVIQRPYPTDGRVIALGTFDGVHLGHQSLLHQAACAAKTHHVPLRVCTFNRHPLDVIRPESAPDQLTTIPEKASLMSGLGVDEMELMNFDRAMAALDPDAFLKRLHTSMQVKAVVAGWNYTFGRKGEGNAKTLCEDGKKNGYDVIIVPPVKTDDGTAISSSLIRQRLAEGNMDDAAKLLGYPYMLTGTVQQGKHQGHRLGFPTANIEPWHRKALPRFGVYACLLRFSGETLHAVTNIGAQPTLPSGRVTVEAHVLESCPELYGRKVRLLLKHMLREEKQFESAGQLKEQIEQDRLATLKYFNMA